jgi:putative protease
MAKTKYELLAPAGDFPSLIAAVDAGADAVYFGLKEFSMRDRAKNFSMKDLEKIKKICKNKGVKKYLTLNTIIYDNENNKLEKIIKTVKGQVDAIICWDFSVISLCKKYKIPFFISTQASVSNINSAKFYKRLGAKRIVLARELNLNQIKKISRIIDVECFIHGAMCVAVSGRCFTSQFLFGESANRGRCLHPCRRSYTVKDSEGNELCIENNKIFSAKDLCMLPYIEEMKKAGIKSFKIEGRSRDARYVDTVVRIYKKALEKKLTKQQVLNLTEELDKIYNKGFSSGFYLKTPGKEDFSTIEHSKAKEKKHFVGKITGYLSKIGVSKIKLVSELKVGDDIVVIGNTTGVQKIKIMEIQKNKKSIKRAVKNEEVGIKTPKLRKNDDVYVLIKT